MFQLLMGVTYFACSVLLADVISFDSERGPKMEKRQGYSLVIFPNFGSL